ncbi:hypothetical protein C8Q72DRAFT_796225 [Fomitopsis betulina]|nr:hypothetical protein C8Q72DRAFT_796225 [Fomitopsis betulina]
MVSYAQTKQQGRSAASMLGKCLKGLQTGELQQVSDTMATDGESLYATMCMGPVASRLLSKAGAMFTGIKCWHAMQCVSYCSSSVWTAMPTSDSGSRQTEQLSKYLSPSCGSPLHSPAVSTPGVAQQRQWPLHPAPGWHHTWSFGRAGEGCRAGVFGKN